MIKLVSIQTADEAINLKLQLRRLDLYNLEELESLYFILKFRVLTLYQKINGLYDVKKLNFAYDFNYGSRYIENCQFIKKAPLKEEVIERIILFYRTEFLINNYLQQLEDIQA
ncbi:hypothetical protein KJ870_00660 [bacterium]|nr:hypothetical protein [bacterium]MBU1433441.1 hypothetical protein [bacterium]MBU1503377.1 hypothetical protein [bacterium]